MMERRSAFTSCEVRKAHLMMTGRQPAETILLASTRWSWDSPQKGECFMTNTEKLADVKTIIEKLGKADRETLIYIHGRVDQALADKQKTPPE